MSDGKGQKVERFLGWLSTTGLYRAAVLPAVRSLFFLELTRKTGNFASTTWLGKPIKQPTLDLWTIQETIFEVQPELLIETGTFQGGSARFYAQLFDLMGRGRVVTVDVNDSFVLPHPRITFVRGSSVDPAILRRIGEEVASARGPVLVILDSDHSEGHVRQELEAFAPFVTPGSYLVVQDGSVDVSSFYQRFRPGPLPAIREFLRRHPEFAVDRGKCEKFVITYHTEGWLKKLGPSGDAEPTRDTGD